MRKFSVRKGQSGFSLIELMIAIVLGLVVVGGIIAVLIASRKSYELQQGNNLNQQTLRFGMAQMDWSIRMADFWGGVKKGSVFGSPAMSGLGGSGSCDAAWVLDYKSGIRGYDGAGSFPIANCVDDANYVAGSDVVVVRYADTTGYSPLTADYKATTVPSRTSLFIVAGVGQQGYLFRQDEAVPQSPLGVNVGRYVYPYQLEMYYLRPCSDPGADGKCGTGDDGDVASRMPTLMRMGLDSTGALASEALVDGVEQLQFDYATGSNKDGAWRSDNYVKASDLNAPDWTKVIAVRASMVARSQVRDVSLPQKTTRYDLSPHCAYTVSDAGVVSFPTLSDTNVCSETPLSAFGDKPQQYTRSISTNVVQIRNRVRG
jgi:type IV pilus assembly protein PilW